MSYAADLLASRDNIAKRIREITSDPKPTYSVDGQSISWGEYLTTLTNQLKVVEEAYQRAGAPFFILSKARS